MNKLSITKNPEMASDNLSADKLSTISEIIEVRDREITDINKQIQDIHGIYSELANIVEFQGDHINKISDNINTTKTTTTLGLEQIQKAEKKQSKCNIS